MELSFLPVVAQFAQTRKAVARDATWERRRSLTSGSVFEYILRVSGGNLVCRFGTQVRFETFEGPLIKTDQATAWGI